MVRYHIKYTAMSENINRCKLRKVTHQLEYEYSGEDSNYHSPFTNYFSIYFYFKSTQIHQILHFFFISDHAWPFRNDRHLTEMSELINVCVRNKHIEFTKTKFKFKFKVLFIVGTCVNIR